MLNYKIPTIHLTIYNISLFIQVLKKERQFLYTISQEKSRFLLTVLNKPARKSALTPGTTEAKIILYAIIQASRAFLE